MSQLDTLEQTINSAIDRIEKSTAELAEKAANQPELTLPATPDPELALENERLKSELAALTARRKADLAELDELLAQLKPLMEEG